jgi:hypothetical protein
MTLICLSCESHELMAYLNVIVEKLLNSDAMFYSELQSNQLSVD